MKTQPRRTACTGHSKRRRAFELKQTLSPPNYNVRCPCVSARRDIAGAIGACCSPKHATVGLMDDCFSFALAMPHNQPHLVSCPARVPFHSVGFILPCPPIRQTRFHTLASHLLNGHLTPRSYLHCLPCMRQNAKPNHAHIAPGIHRPRACSSSRVPCPATAAVAFAAAAAVPFSAVAFSAVPLSGSVPLAARWPWCGGGVSLQSLLG